MKYLIVILFAVMLFSVAVGQSCTPVCDRSLDCGMGKICINAGTCDAECVEGCETRFQCLPAELCCNNMCVLAACKDDTPCIDDDACTVDICADPNTCEAECIHTLLPECGGTPPPPTGPPIVLFQQNIETGQVQEIIVTTTDGAQITDFEALIEYPDKTTITLIATNGRILLPIEKPGIYKGVVKTAEYETSISFEAKTPGQIIPNIPEDRKTIFEAIFGLLVTENPNFLIIWLMAIAIISGLIMIITKLRPAWFRAFISFSYTLLPFAVNHYTKNTWLAFAAIAAQTTILIVIWFRQLKRRRIEEEEAKVHKKELQKEWKREIEQGDLPWLEKAKEESEWDKYSKGRGL